ncbi:MAG: BatA domain-containing protein [Planctomycetaceae bacterium]
MGLLSGWFLAGLAAIAGPIIFHMIRRTPSGRVPFSTLMFLEASPPRMNKRSRIDHWPLLLLRALALGLLALAFARPFLRAVETNVVETAPERQVAVVLDRSASMQRAGLWEQAKLEVIDAFASASDADQMALYAFDHETKAIMTFEEWKELEPATRREVLLERVEMLTPSWGSTNLGGALVIAADDLESLEMEGDDKSDKQPASTVLLVSDIQQGSAVEALQNYEWPDAVELSVKKVDADSSTNAGVELMAQSDVDADLVRVRVRNAADSNTEEFSIKWTDTDGKVLKESRPVYVARSRSGIVSFEPPSGVGSSQIVLSGDTHDFDNTLFVDQLRKNELSVLYVGKENEDDPESIRFYLTRAFPQTAARSVTVLPPEQNGVQVPMDPTVSLVVIADQLEGDRINELRKYLESGGTALFVAQTAAGANSVAPLLSDDQAFEAREADVRQYALIEQIDFAHPVFAPFADAQFADFTRINVWKHRSLPESGLGDAKILARFDNGDPAFVSKTIGRGRMFVLATGWQPSDSQLALSTKFVPLMNNILEQGNKVATVLPRMKIGDELNLQPFRMTRADQLRITMPDGTTAALEKDAATFDGTMQPGVYQLNGPLMEARFAVNVDPRETDTSLMALEQLESLGVTMDPDDGGPADLAAATMRERQLKSQELEKQQKLWRWLVIAAIAVLLLETWLAGRMASRAPHAQPATAQGGTA